MLLGFCILCYSLSTLSHVFAQTVVAFQIFIVIPQIMERRKARTMLGRMLRFKIQDLFRVLRKPQLTTPTIKTVMFTTSVKFYNFDFDWGDWPV